MANYPNSIPSFTSKSAGQTIQPAHLNDAQDEIVAIGTQLLTATSYTPAWTNTGTANSIGNGALTGSYIQHGKKVHFRATITWGNTTSSGNGFWLLSLPVTADSFILGGGCSGLAFDTSAGSSYPLTCTNNGTTTVFPSAIASPVAAVTATTPFTWATGDSLTIVGWYIAA